MSSAKSNDNNRTNNIVTPMTTTFPDAVNQTPTKSYHRRQPSISSMSSFKDKCRLCGQEKKQLQKIFSKIGKMKYLQEKIIKGVDIMVAEDDELSTSICKVCENFINKISVFQENCQGVTDSIITVTKRCVKESDESLNVQGISHKKLRFADEPLPSQAQEENLVLSDVLDAEANSPVECAKLIFESCPNILKEIEILMLSKIKETADSLCTRKDGNSILFQKDFKSLATLEFDTIFQELSEKFPFVSQILKVMGSKNEIAAEESLPKFGFIYSILMSTRWHELSRLKRVMTILLIEGGCTKKVSI